jgi:lipopolysaccharide/colanic/teichoic acid biosynthesis glycosyltransferase
MPVNSREAIRKTNMGSENSEILNGSHKTKIKSGIRGSSSPGVAFRIFDSSGDNVSELKSGIYPGSDSASFSNGTVSITREQPVKYPDHRIFAVDLAILSGSFLLAALYKPATANYLSGEYLTAFFVLLASWSFSSFYFRKYNIREKHQSLHFIRSILLSNFVALGSMLVVITLFWHAGYSRVMLFGTIGLATMIELFTGSIYRSLLQTTSMNGYDLFIPPARSSEIRQALVARNFPESTLESEIIKKAVAEECGKGIYSFMQRYLDGECNRTLFISTGSRINIEMHPSLAFLAIVNMKRVNDIKFINKFFEVVNRKLPVGGTFIGCAETKDQRKERIMMKYPPLLNRAIYALDYLLKRVFPKFVLTRKIYYFLTRGQNRVVSRAELLGRLYSCGFELINDEIVNGLYCFAVKKVKSPVYDLNPTYGPFIKLRRVGKDGRIIRVYKFRTMHPYAEYLQDYIFKNNNLENGGKYKNDFRVTTLGRLMRCLWIDELPMIFNLLKGDVKLVGVRPLSMNYFCLYDKELQEKRIKFKPGLIPPFYADMPGTLDEIQASEYRYLQNYENRPFFTDLDYFRRAFINIAIKKARSR